MVAVDAGDGVMTGIALALAAGPRRNATPSAVAEMCLMVSFMFPRFSSSDAPPRMTLTRKLVKRESLLYLWISALGEYQ